METMINKTVNDNQHMMTSLEIAEVTGKNHKDVLKAIRKMEQAWVDVCGRKFALTSRTVVQPNGGTREVPCYQLTKTECLYIATKFNDEARARLVLRWEQLEMERLNTVPTHLPTLAVQKKILAMADEIVGTGLRMLNQPAEDTLTATQVAKTFNMNTRDFNAVLEDLKIQYRANGRWNLAEHLQGRGYTAERTHVDYSLKGKRKVKVYMTWTMAGLKYLNSQLGYPNL